MPDTVQIDTTFSRLKSRSSSWFQEFEERFNRTLLIAFLKLFLGLLRVVLVSKFAMRRGKIIICHVQQDPYEELS